MGDQVGGREADDPHAVEAVGADAVPVDHVVVGRLADVDALVAVAQRAGAGDVDARVAALDQVLLDVPGRATGNPDPLDRVAAGHILEDVVLVGDRRPAAGHHLDVDPAPQATRDRGLVVAVGQRGHAVDAGAHQVPIKLGQVRPEVPVCPGQDPLDRDPVVRETVDAQPLHPVVGRPDEDPVRELRGRRRRRQVGHRDQAAVEFDFDHQRGRVARDVGRPRLGVAVDADPEPVDVLDHRQRGERLDHRHAARHRRRQQGRRHVEVDDHRRHRIEVGLVDRVPQTAGAGIIGVGHGEGGGERHRRQRQQKRQRASDQERFHGLSGLLGNRSSGHAPGRPARVSPTAAERVAGHRNTNSARTHGSLRWVAAHGFPTACAYLGIGTHTASVRRSAPGSQENNFHSCNCCPPRDSGSHEFPVEMAGLLARFRV